MTPFLPSRKTQKLECCYTFCCLYSTEWEIFLEKVQFKEATVHVICLKDNISLNFSNASSPKETSSMQKTFQKHEYQQIVDRWQRSIIFAIFSPLHEFCYYMAPQLLENIKNQISIFETKEHGGPQKITQNIIYMTKVYYSSLFVFFVVFVAFQQVAFLNCPRLIQSNFYQSTTYLFRKNRFMLDEMSQKNVLVYLYFWISFRTFVMQAGVKMFCSSFILSLLYFSKLFICIHTSQRQSTVI